MLFNTNSAIFQLYHGREEVNVQGNNHEIRFVLDQYAYLYLYSASSLIRQSVDRHVAPLGNIILISSQQVSALSP
jgi:hypothetical protein